MCRRADIFAFWNPPTVQLAARAMECGSPAPAFAVKAVEATQLFERPGNHRTPRSRPVCAGSRAGISELERGALGAPQILFAVSRELEAAFYVRKPSVVTPLGIKEGINGQEVRNRKPYLSSQNPIGRTEGRSVRWWRHLVAKGLQNVGAPTFLRFGIRQPCSWQPVLWSAGALLPLLRSKQWRPNNCLCERAITALQGSRRADISNDQNSQFGVAA